jgi:dTDP-4-amino-4,6-dideoxygalactose transaminase
MKNEVVSENYFKKINRKIKNVVRRVQFIANPKPQLVCGTLDFDDVHIAKNQLKNRHNWINTSVETEFSEKFAKWNGSRHAFAFLSGRAALSACIFALDLLPGDEVIVPGYTCVVVQNAFEYSQLKIIYSDIELDTFGLDITSLERNITPKTKAILLQHLYGLVSKDYEKIINLAKKHNIYVIEDCAHSTGATYKNKRIGNLGHVAFYSSELSKIFNTIQGGVVVTNDEYIAKNLSRFHEHASYPDNEHIEKQLYNVIINFYRFKHPLRNLLGPKYESLYKNKLYNSTTEEEVLGIKPKDYGCKMPAAIAALGINQLKKIERYNQKRRDTSLKWAHWCETHHYQKPVVVVDSVPVFLRYPILVEPEKKQNLSWAVQDPGVVPGRWFLSNIHPAPKKVSGCPNADKAVNECINFPTLL